MATVRIPEQERTLTSFDEIREFLAGMEIASGSCENSRAGQYNLGRPYDSKCIEW